MLKEEIKFENSTVFEGMTSIRSIIKAIDNNVSDRKIEKIIFDTSKIKKITKEIGYLRAVCMKYGFSLEESDAETIEKITVGSSHGGIVAFAKERTVPYLKSENILENGFYAMIEGIEDPYNFGYALRSLFPCGCDGIILQERNWLSAAGVVARSSAGASELLPVYKFNPSNTLDLFAEKGYNIVCADENTNKILGKCELKKPILLVVGGEKRGISRAVLDRANIKVKIDYAREFRASLSAASATTMFAYEIMRQN